jgi:hypothetical protein
MITYFEPQKMSFLHRLQKMSFLREILCANIECLDIHTDNLVRIFEHFEI